MSVSRTPAPVGERFGYLTVLGEGAPHYSQRSAYRGRRANTRTERTFRVLCDCGEEVTLLASNVRNGRTTSCGKHGHGAGRKPHKPVTYGSAHTKIRKLRGRAPDYQCVGCGTTAMHWAYNNACEEEVQAWSNGDNAMVRYCEHPEHYAPMCGSCHQKFDYAERAIRNDQV